MEKLLSCKELNIGTPMAFTFYFCLHHQYLNLPKKKICQLFQELITTVINVMTMIRFLTVQFITYFYFPNAVQIACCQIHSYFYWICDVIDIIIHWKPDYTPVIYCDTSRITMLLTNLTKISFTYYELLNLCRTVPCMLLVSLCIR